MERGVSVIAFVLAASGSLLVWQHMGLSTNATENGGAAFTHVPDSCISLSLSSFNG